MDPVAGYKLITVAEPHTDLGRHNDDMCKIIGRASGRDVTDKEILDLGPAFIVEFGDGSRHVVFAEELRPWYAID